MDRDRLRALVARGPEPIFAIISGAHLYGFASPDSDIDLRGAFLLSCREILGLEPPVETLTIEEKTDVELDWVAHDVRKFARLLTRHNGYALEQLYSPLVVLGTDSFEELRELGRGCVTRPTVRHYRGFARGRRLRLREPDPTVKHLLYAYRVLLSGIHLMNTGEIEANILTLNDIFAIERVQELVERKREGAEKMSLSAEELSAHEAHLDSLERALDEAYETSALPMEPTTTRALEDFVIRLRLETLGGRS
ncbi:MAG: nucleotidyltransferase domain-containing protein [Deltaproteobacteria bacterium]|nr:nucleotidyltransferase domain-containing protein [Deltaproteobacteria bacterium]